MCWDKIRKAYENGAKYADIRTKYNVSNYLIRKHKQSEHWKKLKNKNGTKKSKKVKNNKIAVNDGLSPEDNYFCYLRASQRIPSYKAYKISRGYKKGHKIKDSSAMSLSSKLEKQEKIKLRIVKIQKNGLRKRKWDLPNVLKQLNFLYEQALADILMYGVNKSNTDAAFNALDRIIQLNSLIPKEQAMIKNIEFTNKIKELRIKAKQNGDHEQMTQLDNLLEQVQNSAKK
ncbi:hypothetical protein DY120_07315 [Apilactobacillus micheneri]|uniref:Terminase small subunit n=1 Tax=Apilactobacillus micheneri TaxID=1899430 RepID=A0ABY2YV71_9LACO|nr:hypothetical protein [Apilactobacillus micheneri]TPR23107.1 hypothetical protein DY114_07300 [Apilactobacillus micheneri]TPR24425.1 hypothetical protein DY111_07315 [Apilactobacillus micheneri]TPR29372.1 hypothetical protein DY120_07315 [Apilactobacillus micheneri]TPR34579.1 hypothetical protein DY027_07305 [Apilactobacillus micheneri]